MSEGGPGRRFRLVEYGPGPNTFPHVYQSALEAVLAAETLLAALETRPHRRPFRVDVVDVWTRETVSRVEPDVARDPDVCVACGQPNDPFASSGELSPFAPVDVPPFTPPVDGGPSQPQGTAAGGASVPAAGRIPVHDDHRLTTRPRRP